MEEIGLCYANVPNTVILVTTMPSIPLELSEACRRYFENGFSCMRSNVVYYVQVKCDESKLLSNCNLHNWLSE